jgi:hypothetical protein
MVPDVLPVSQFFEGAKPETPPMLFIVPIVLAVLFLPLIDLVTGLAARFHRK